MYLGTSGGEISLLTTGLVHPERGQHQMPPLPPVISPAHPYLQSEPDCAYELYSFLSDANEIENKDLRIEDLQIQ